jgi:hypothetical protein
MIKDGNLLCQWGEISGILREPKSQETTFHLWSIIVQGQEGVEEFRYEVREKGDEPEEDEETDDEEVIFYEGVITTDEIQTLLKFKILKKENIKSKKL